MILLCNKICASRYIKSAIWRGLITYKVLMFREFFYFYDSYIKKFVTCYLAASAIVGGVFGIQESFGSSFEYILNQKGSQIQQELGILYVFYALLLDLLSPVLYII